MFAEIYFVKEGRDIGAILENARKDVDEFTVYPPNKFLGKYN